MGIISKLTPHMLFIRRKYGVSVLEHLKGKIRKRDTIYCDTLNQPLPDNFVKCSNCEKEHRYAIGEMMMLCWRCKTIFSIPAKFVTWDGWVD